MPLGDPEEMLDEPERQVLVARVHLRQDQREVEHVLAEHGHPGRAVGLFQVAAGRQRGAAVEHADVVEAEEPALEQVLAVGVLAVEPPREVQHQLLEGVAQEVRLLLAARARSRGVGEQGGPGVHGRVDVAEVPLVGGDLPARVQVHIAEDELDLLPGERGIDHAQRHTVEGQVPRRVPGVFPAVGHGQDVPVLHVEPVPVPDIPALGIAQRMCLVLLQPAVEVEVVELLAPEHPGQRPPHDHGVLGVGAGRGDRLVELVGLGAAAGDHGVRVGAQLPAGRGGGSGRPQPPANGRGAAGRNQQPVARRPLGAGAGGVHGVGAAVHHV